MVVILMAEKKEKEPRLPFMEIAGFKCFADSMNYIVMDPNGHPAYYSDLKSMIKGIKTKMESLKIRDKKATKSIGEWQEIMCKQHGELCDIAAKLERVDPHDT
jgi:hypothetical protein